MVVGLAFLCVRLWERGRILLMQKVLGKGRRRAQHRHHHQSNDKVNNSNPVLYRALLDSLRPTKTKTYEIQVDFSKLER